MVNQKQKSREESPIQRSSISPQHEPSSKNYVKSFYGNKPANLRWTKKPSPKKIQHNDDENTTTTKEGELEKDDEHEVEKPVSPVAKTQPVKRFYKRDDIFWTANVYGKKRKTDSNHTRELRTKERRIDTDDSTSSKSPVLSKISCSTETQTSFSSSQEGSQQSSCSSPVAFARSSPFINCTGSNNCSINESSEIDVNDDEASNSDESEPYEMFNCDTSTTSQLNSSIKSDDRTMSPQKTTPAVTPTRKKSTPTILNYFTRKVDNKSDGKSSCSKLTSPPSCGTVVDGDVKKKKEQKQLHFSKTGLASRDEEKRDESVLFDLPTATSSTRTTPRGKKKRTTKNKNTCGTPKEQMYIDVGQRDFGHVKCDTCGMVYTKSQEEDEEQHAKYHQRIVQKLRFKGWKNERVLEEFPDGRIICIRHSDYFMHLKKLNEIREVVDTELGFASSQARELQQDEQAFLFICSKKVIGCVIAVPITKGYPIIPDSNRTVGGENENGEANQSWCCSTEPVKALCGISRIWVFSQSRRRKIATRIVECIRINFLYGCFIDKKYLAFSDPTPNGRVFAENYIGKKDVLVFR